jgi:hypothetical protein
MTIWVPTSNRRLAKLGDRPLRQRIALTHSARVSCASLFSPASPTPRRLLVLRIALVTPVAATPALSNSLPRSTPWRSNATNSFSASRLSLDAASHSSVADSGHRLAQSLPRFTRLLSRGRLRKAVTRSQGLQRTMRSRGTLVSSAGGFCIANGARSIRNVQMTATPNQALQRTATDSRAGAGRFLPTA